jgi:diaminopimelate decarboxylase
MQLHPSNAHLSDTAWGKKFGYPLYLYDGNLIQAQFDALKNSLRDHRHQIRYACKANSNLYILHLLEQRGGHLDIVSLNEGRLGEMAGFPAERIHFTPNGVSLAECEAAIHRGYSLSLDHIPSIRALAARHPGLSLCLRINPRVKAGGHHKISVGHSSSKFGLAIDQIDEVQAMQSQGLIRIVGMHIHTGSDIGDVDALKKGADVLFREAAKFKESLAYLDFGGGFKVAYSQTDSATDIEEIGKWLSRRVKDFERENDLELQLVVEPGKYLLSAAGFFLAEVSQLKTTYGTAFAHISSGFNHFIRPMYYEANHHISVLGNTEKRSKQKYNVVGYLCETDTFAEQRLLPQLAVGDILAFHNAGAYSFSMASQYNQRLRPAEVLLLNGEAHLIREREVFSDLLVRQVPLHPLKG